MNLSSVPSNRLKTRPHCHTSRRQRAHRWHAPMSRPGRWLWFASLAVVSLLVSERAAALPGFFATEGKTVPQSFTTQIAVMKRGDDAAVTVMTDYKGPMKPFAWVLPVPSDVKLADVKVLKRGALERLEEITAPRFHEFWEMDPCDTETKHEQIWERKLSASAGTDFLGGADMFKNTKKVPKVMRERLDPDYRTEGHGYKLSLVASGVERWLKQKGYSMPAGLSLDSHRDKSFLVAEVDPKLLELGAKGEAVLSPLRYFTQQGVELATTLGNPHIGSAHELLIYVFSPEGRYQVDGYKNIFPPTNIEVDFKVKERMGDYYAHLHDMMAAKQPKAFVTEYAWETKTCGEPCPDAPLKLFELLTLGAEEFEKSVPAGERNPKPPERTDEEQAQFDAIDDKEERARIEKVRKEVARRAALFKRHENYTLTRLHYRADKSGMPSDVTLTAAGPIEGGVDIPQGVKGELPQGEKPGKTNKFQTRMYHLHPNKVVLKCDDPKHYRWGKPPRTYRGARKIWVADQLANRDRKRIVPTELTHTSIPSLDIQGVPKPSDKPIPPPAAEEDKSSCSVAAVAGDPTRTSLGAFASLIFGLALMARRRRHRPKNRGASAGR